MSTHCCIMQQWMQPASKRPQGKHARWRHTEVVGECHVLTWLLRDIPRWHHTAPGVGEHHVTSMFPQVTSHSLPLRPLLGNGSNTSQQWSDRFPWSLCRGVILKTIGATKQIPCGGGVENLHRDPASRRRRRNGKSQIWDSKIRMQVPRD
jgi:hypothetical protein